MPQLKAGGGGADVVAIHLPIKHSSRRKAGFFIAYVFEEGR